MESDWVLSSFPPDVFFETVLLLEDPLLPPISFFPGYGPTRQPCKSFALLPLGGTFVVDFTRSPGVKTDLSFPRITPPPVLLERQHVCPPFCAFSLNLSLVYVPGD